MMSTKQMLERIIINQQHILLCLAANMDPALLDEAKENLDFLKQIWAE